MSKKGTIDAMLIVRRLQEEYHCEIKMLYVCYADVEKAFERVT